MSKLYDSYAWMRLHYVTKRETPEQIAKQCGCTKQTIYRKLIGHGLMKTNKKY